VHALQDNAINAIYIAALIS